MNAAHFSPDTWDLIRLLDHYRVEYVIVGGEAVIHYGYVRVTGDVDFFYGTVPENTERLFRALVDFWDGDVPGLDSASELSEPGQVVQFGRPPNRIDLLASITGVSFAEAWQSRVPLVSDDGTRLFLIALDLLIQNKEASGRPKDAADAAFLRALARPSGQD